MGVGLWRMAHNKEGGYSMRERTYRCTNEGSRCKSRTTSAKFPSRQAFRKGVAATME